MTAISCAKQAFEKAIKLDAFSSVNFLNYGIFCYRNKDYNIVYREKPTKPMTVSELFGIGKKEEPKKAAKKPADTAETKVETSENKVKAKVETSENKVKARVETAENNIKAKLDTLSIRMNNRFIFFTIDLNT